VLSRPGEQQSLVYGPARIVNQINQDNISRQISLWDQGRSV